jgi:hypothetical protein
MKVSRHVAFRLVLSLLLLFAQQEAMAHQAGHILDNSKLHSQQQDQDSAKHPHSLCDFHGAFEGVLGAVNSAIVNSCVVSQQFERDIAPEPLVFSALALIRGARDPPVSILS